MTVRAVLARPRGAAPNKFEGVYLHNAGGPSEMGPVLWALVRDRYAFDATGFGREMIDENLEGWSNIDCLGGPLAKTWDGKTKITVNQHQENFNNDRPDPGPTSFKGDPTRALPGITSPPINEGSDNWGADFVYIVGPAGLRVLLTGARGYHDLGLSPWGETEPDWDAIEARAGAVEGDGEGERGGPAPMGGSSGSAGMTRVIQGIVGLILLGVVITIVWFVVGALRGTDAPAPKPATPPPAATAPKKK